MKLDDVGKAFGIEVLRDGIYESVGLVSYATPRLLVFVESERYLAELVANEHVSCVVTTAELAPRVPENVGVGVAERPREAFYRLHNQLATETDFYWASFATEIAQSASVHPRAYVAERNVRIGARCVIEPHATILERSILGDDCIVRAGTVIGGEGFQVVDLDGALLPVRHAGGVRLGARVEIQHNCCVDRSVFGGFTVIGEETKADNRVHIAHNCSLGKRNRLAAGAMLAGSVTTGDDVWLGPMAAISDGIRIGARASITIGAVVTRDVDEGARVSGNFAIDHAKFITHMRSIR